MNIKPSFKLDDIKQYKTEGKIEPKVLAEYRMKPKYGEKGERTFCLIDFCPCQENSPCDPQCGCEYTV